MINKNTGGKMSKSNKTFTRILWALFWIAVGILWLMSNRGILPFNFNWGEDWPIIFVVIGVAMLFNLITCSLKTKKECSFSFDSSTGKTKSGKAKWLKIRVYENNDDNPKVKITLPISVIKSAVKIGGKFNFSIPEKVREKMAEKNVDFDADLFDNIDEMFDEFAVNGRYEIINVVDDGDRVEIYVE